MPTNHLHPSKKNITLLKREVENFFGKSITQHTDCIALSDDINKKIKPGVSYQTLRRFFGLIQSPSQPSIHTLSSLCRYCGYSDWEEFKSTQQTKEEINSINFEIIELFFQIEPSKWQDDNYFKASRNIAKYIYNNKSVTTTLLPKLAKSKAAQWFLFEASPFIDSLNNTFKEGLKYYLNFKKDHQAQVFGNTLLFLGALLTENKSGIEKHYKTISSLPFDDTIFCLPLARQIGTHIVYNKIKFGDDYTNKWLSEDVLFYAKQHNKELSSDDPFPGYYFKMAEYLILAKCYTESYSLLKPYMPVLKEMPKTQHSYDQVDAVKILYAEACFYTNRKVKAAEIIKQVDLSNLCFLFKKYYSIKYFLLQLALTSNAAKIKRSKLVSEVSKLIAETGFTYFNTQLNSLR